MIDAEQLLSNLRDIQEPAAPEGVSLLLIAANITLVMIILATLFIRRRRRRESWRQEALNCIFKARMMEPQAGLLSLAKLLRQLIHYRHGNSSELDGQAWLDQLDQEFKTQWFSQDEGQIFGEALYTNQSAGTVNLILLCDSLSTLVKSLPVTLPTNSAGKP